MRKSVLMSSVSLAALAAVATAAQAQDSTVPDGYTLSVEGGLLFGTNTVAEDKLGSGPSGGIVNIQDNMGYRAAIALGKRIDPFWDLRVGAAINHQMESNSSFEYSGGGSGFSGNLMTDFDYETMDFEAGYRPQLDENMNVRLFGGVRGLHYTDSADKVGTQYSGGPDKLGIETDYNSEFLGVGPRIGVEGSTRFGDSMFGVSGLLAGSAIFGVARSDFEASVSSGGNSLVVEQGNDEESRTVYNIEAALGLDVHVTEDAKLTFGYRAEGLFGVEGFSGGSGGSDSRWTHGPTVKFEGNF